MSVNTNYFFPFHKVTFFVNFLCSFIEYEYSSNYSLTRRRHCQRQNHLIFHNGTLNHPLVLYHAEGGNIQEESAKAEEKTAHCYNRSKGLELAESDFMELQFFDILSKVARELKVRFWSKPGKRRRLGL